MEQQVTIAGATEPGWFVDLTQFSPADYGWQDGRLVAHGIAHDTGANPAAGLAGFIVKHVYADHNSSRAVERALHPLLETLRASPDKVGLNFGAGGVRLDPRILNLDIQNKDHIDLVSNGGKIPLKDQAVDLVITQEVLEHIGDYEGALQELARVLKPGGTIYCQLPFQIGFHPGPCDYRRFSRHGMQWLFRSDQWDIETVGVAVGHGTALYRIFVEFMAVTASALHRSLYRPAKGLAAILLYPLKLFDGLTERSEEKDRIAGGYYLVAKRTTAK